MTREEYDSVDAINYSTLSKMHDDPKKLLLPPSKPGRGRLMGSTIDCLIFSGQEFNDRFFISEAKLPAEKMLAMLERYLELTGNDFLPINENMVMAARTDVEFAMNWGRSTVITKFEEACFDYLSELIVAGNRLVIDKRIKETCDQIATEVLTNKFTYDVITRGDIVLNQPTFIWNQKIDDSEGKEITVKCKGIADNITVRDLDKETVLVYINDGKYSSQGWKTFEKDFVNWNYHLQPPMYILAVNSLVNGTNEYCEEPLKDILRGKKVMIFFRFIIYTEGNLPLIYTLPSDLITLGFYGGTLYNGARKKGINRLIVDYLRHKALEYYDYPWDIYDNAGTLDLSIPCSVNRPLQIKPQTTQSEDK